MIKWVDGFGNVHESMVLACFMHDGQVWYVVPPYSTLTAPVVVSDGDVCGRPYGDSAAALTGCLYDSF